ncbi:unnamed protein product [Ceratitis capitata]|uniref:(Mediterranean fruit fly) hypothetical protein n=1 Tax=Ceratitis capitata TaxID=7213 RepID=A0A811U644_CERCA|nr:unnamed protein product [Ceratitis capitata]
MSLTTTTTLMTANTTTVNATITTKAVHKYTHTPIYTQSLGSEKCRLECGGVLPSSIGGVAQGSTQHASVTVTALFISTHTYIYTYIHTSARMTEGTDGWVLVINHFNCHFRNTILSKQQSVVVASFLLFWNFFFYFNIFTLSFLFVNIVAVGGL